MSDAAETRARMVASLMRSGAYTHPVDTVEHIETHISDVFLAGDFAYKVKKPVNFGFCDFSTRGLREKLTRRELELNQRLSSGVYLSVEEVQHDPASGEYSVNGSGDAVEPALRMRRLRAEDRLDRLLASGQAGEPEIKQVAALLARFHRDAAPADSKFASPAQVSDVVLGNMERVREHGSDLLPAAALADVQGFAEAFLQVRRRLLQQRFDAGMPRMCHGDLHAGNIFLEKAAGGQPAAGSSLTPALSSDKSRAFDFKGRGEEEVRRVQVIDCIEFNDSFTYIDPAADIAFLSMDLRHAGMPGLAGLLVRSYAEASGDRGITAVLPFYESYRAMVRCMAACISAGQAADGERSGFEQTAQEYLQTATKIVADERPQFLAVMAGITGTGKSTVARAISEQWGAVHLQTDVIRKELAGLSPLARTSDAVRQGIYSSEMSRKTYREMQRRAVLALREGKSVIMDGTHLKTGHRAQSLAAAVKTGAKTVVIECTLNETQTLRRLKERYEGGRSESEGRPYVYLAQKPEWEPVQRHEAATVARVDASMNAMALQHRLFHDLWSGLLKPAA